MSSRTRKQIEYPKREARDPRSLQARTVLKYLSYMKFWLATAVLSAFPLAVSAQTWSWSFQDLDLLGGSGTSIVADQDGNLHLSYYLESGGQLKYGFLPAGGSKWYTMTLESNWGEMETGIDVDKAGNPAICYTPRTLRYIRWDGHAWASQEVDHGSGLIQYICSIRFDPRGRPMLSWYLVTKHLRYAILSDGAWRAVSVDQEHSEPGKWNSIALDSKGFPHIAFSDFPAGRLMYGWFDGEKWSAVTVDTPYSSDRTGGERGMGASLILDSQGNPIIGYYDLQSLKVARLLDGKWKKEVVQELPPFGKWGWQSFRSSMALDKHGFLHIGFESLLGLEHAWWDGKTWHTQLIVSAAGEPKFENSMAIGPDDTVYMPFLDPSDRILRLAVGHKVSDSPAVGKDKGK